MKWVKCLYNGSSDNGLTIGKIYKVINHYPGSVWDERVEIIKDRHVIDIINDKGESVAMYMKDGDGVWFEDADAEVRDNKINQIIK